MGTATASEILHYTPTLLAQAEARRARLQRFSEAAARLQRRQKLSPSQVLALMAPVVKERIPKPMLAPVKRRQYETRKVSPVSSLSSRIISAVAAEFSLTPEQLCGQDRTAHHCTARFVAIGLLMEMTQLSLPAIGRRLGGRDHTTVLHGSRRAHELFASEAVRNRLDQIKVEIGA